ncbi:MAG TPA: beta-ketoacyl-[acyl-carrier-protein] synthase family protein [Candidatus Baltobacteraceae bacterium]|jgi:3-oxoacyl-[acyl-carrier-protein] synthase II|nr:beta-ketoacyl-[acyl-carrier-protein] synthase family protein [Candidatus Baltobacteraceae bacterium]
MNIDLPERRVVITGMGVISPNGKDIKTFWANVRGGVSAAAPVSRFDASRLPVKIAAEVKDFDVTKYIHSRKPGRFDLTIQYGVAAAAMAVTDSGVDLQSIEPDRVGVVEGTTISGAGSIIKARDSFVANDGNYRALHPYNVIAGYCGEGSSTISLHLGIRGHAVTYCSGCASGNDAIGYAMRMIQSDDLDVVVAGGSEETMEMLHVGFCRVRAMTEQTGEPSRAMKPFDRHRDGFLLGEGAAFFVVEELSHALGRGARIYAEIVGHGRSCEAYHATDPHPEGVGYARAIEKALRHARIDPAEVSYINAHGSATPLNDPIETLAIKRVFREHARRVSISATKPTTGHLMGASGALETTICALSIWHQEIPPTMNLDEPDPNCDLDYVPGVARSFPVRVALNLNAGFGGRYACLVLRRY